MIASENWEFDDFNTFETLGLVGEESELNIWKSITQFSQATVRQEGDYRVFVSNFSFPFDYQFLRRIDLEAAQARPYLLLQVNSSDWWGRNRIEGYGFL